MLNVTNIDHIAIEVTDLQRAIDFWSGTLGMELVGMDVYQAGRRPFVSVKVGNSLIDLFPSDPVAKPPRAHFCLLADFEDFDRVIAHLKERGAQGEFEPRRRWGATGWGLSIYLKDPDGNQVEIKQKRPLPE